jgi:hypothetical protein
MQGKWKADNTTRGLERGQWTMQGRVVEVAVLQPVNQCDGETMSQHNYAADVTGRQHNNADNRTPRCCVIGITILWYLFRCVCVLVSG